MVELKSLKISEKTKEKLDRMKISDSESYDETISRIINMLPEEVKDLNKKVDDPLLRKIVIEHYTKYIKQVKEL